MPPYRYTAAQRDEFDRVVLQCIQEGRGEIQKLREWVSDTLRASTEQWKRAMGRDSGFNTLIRTSLYRMRDDGLIRCEKHGVWST